MWGGRFASGPAEIMEEINASIDFDRKLAMQDIAGSQAHVAMLAAQGVVTPADAEAIAAGLAQVKGEIEAGAFAFSRALEDIHMNVEQRLAQLAHGEIAALGVDKNPKRATPVNFSGADGRKLTLDDFRGKALVLNLWATWCVPCRSEMPALDRLQAKAGSPDFEVVAVNVDTARLDRPKAFLDQIGVKSLTRYADPSGDAFENLRLAGKALGLPTSLLIDKDGCELGVVAGPVDWASDDGLKVVEALKGG